MMNFYSHTMSAMPSKAGPRSGATPKQVSATLLAQLQSAPATRQTQPSHSAMTSAFEDASTAIGNLEYAYKFLIERKLVPALDGTGSEEGDFSGA